MEEKKGYNVLKLVMHGNRCYISTDYVRGKPLIQWLKYHPEIPKEQLFSWVRDILRDLDCFHQSQGFPAYQYVNPYSMIISEEMKIYLLDPGGKGHEELLHIMQRKMVREHFLSPENQFYQKADVTEDIYGFGKSLQYMIASVEVIPSLTRKEERKLRRIISKCLNQKSKKSYKTIREISLHFPKSKENTKSINKERLKNILYLLSLCLLLGVDSYLVILLNEKENEIEKIQNIPPQIETKVEIVEKQPEGKLREILLEAAITYILEYDEYEKSKEILKFFEEDFLAADLLQYISYLQNQDLSEEQLEELLLQMETDAVGCVFWEEKEYQEFFRSKAMPEPQEEESTNEKNNPREEENICVEN